MRPWGSYVLVAALVVLIVGLFAVRYRAVEYLLVGVLFGLPAIALLRSIAWAALWRKVSAIRCEDGFLIIPTTPGIGIELALGAREKYPPVRRTVGTRLHVDGSVIDQ